MPSHQPDPFEKYLYSGSSYVLVVESYGTVLNWLQNSSSADLDSQVTDELVRGWRHFCCAIYPALLHAPAGEAEPTNAGEDATQLEAVLIDCGTRIASEIKSRLESMNPEQLDIDTFFNLWIEVCSSAYAELIRSDKLVDILAQTINRLLRQGDTLDFSYRSNPSTSI